MTSSPNAVTLSRSVGALPTIAWNAARLACSTGRYGRGGDAGAMPICWSSASGSMPNHISDKLAGLEADDVHHAVVKAAARRQRGPVRAASEVP